MKFATVNIAGSRRVGLVSADLGRIWLLEAHDMVDFIGSHVQATEGLRPSGSGLPLKSLKLDAPIPVPRRNVLCVGINYRSHAREFASGGSEPSTVNVEDAIPSVPIFFTKMSGSVIADGEPIRYPRGVSDKVDYEAELGVIIGKGGRSISRESAYKHVFGYTIINDVTARDLQHRHKQWFIGKSLDTFCPMGPWITTADELDPENLRLRCWVNGELRQSASTAELVFDIPTLIATLSAGMTLLPGDIIATGTPMGVGMGFDPPKYLRPGDEVAIEISGLGRLTNPVV